MSEPAASRPDEPSPRTVGNTFMRQYYHFLAKEPQSLHRFYKTESRWCHGFGSHMEEPIAGQRAINDEILKRSYAGARVELDAGSIDCQPSLGGGVLVLVTGVMTLRSEEPKPKPFVQTFFLAVQPKGFFVLNDCLRFLELPRAERGQEEEPVEKKEMEMEMKVEVPEAGGTEEEGVKEESGVPVETTSGEVANVEKDEVGEHVTAASSSSSFVEKPMVNEVEEDAVPVAVETVSPVKSILVTKQEGVVAAAPADPVVPAPVEPEKPKTWAALFSAPTTAATVTPPAAVVPQAATVKPVVTKDVAASTSVPAPAAVSPSSGSPALERSPKSKPSKEKEQKRLYSLFIRDLPPQMRDSDLRDLFKGYGSIAGVNVVAQRNFAFVDYYEQESMRAALAETKEFKVLDKVLQVSERGDRKDGQRSNFRGNDSRGRGRGGHGPKSGRGDRKERSGDDAPSFSKGDRREGPRREKMGNRRGGKVDATSHNRAE
uniref:NTF2 domain-containing protein n=1 Tax=Hyaloperonospora arabidopsidis (strain Emoy2) TaxID=559515 RepID=M4BI34_HYAAE